ncbi:MAG: PAS domain-containing protein [Opitutae bacterium]|nr:PAS domain-containing protein [Opitutae bacterium]
MPVRDLKLSRIARNAAWSTCALGALGLIGGITDIEILQRLWPHGRPMSVNTAISLMVGGAALLLLQQQSKDTLRRIAGQVLAVLLVVAAGGATLGATLGIDLGQFGAALGVAFDSSSSNRLVVNAALPLCLAGLGLLALAHERRHWFGISNWLGLAVTSFAILSLGGEIAGPSEGPIAVASSLGLLLLGIAIVCARLTGEIVPVFSRINPLGYFSLVLLCIGLVVPLFMFILGSWWLAPLGAETQDTGLLLNVGYSVVIFGVLTYALRRMDTIDQRRLDAETSRDLLTARLQQQAANLEVLVGERTQELQKTTERLDLALRAGSFGVWDWDLVNKRVYWDHHQCALYGYTPTEFDGTSGAWLARIHPEDREQVQEEIGRALAADEGFEDQFRIALPDGTERHIQTLGVLRRDGSGRVTRVVGIDRDVTEEHARARELASLNDRLSLAIKATGYGVWEMDLATRRMIWDDRMLEIYGIDRSAFSGAVQEWHDRVLPEDADQDDHAIAEAIAGHTPIYQSQFRIRRPDGTLRHIEALGIIQRGRDGSALRLVGLDRDITEAKELREELRISQERWQLALTGTNDGVWDWDLVSGLIYRDARFAGMIGYRTDELPARHVWLEIGHADDVAHAEQAMAEHLAGRTPIYQAEYRLRHKDGHWVWILGRGKVVARDAAGAPTRVVGTHTDITQRKELEERLRHGEEMSLQLSRLAHIGAWEWDLNTARLTWSPEMFRIHEVELGFEPTLEKTLSFYPPEARHTLTEAMENAVRAGSGFDLELPFINARGHKLWVRVLGRAQLKDGRATRLYGAFQDITGRRDAEEMRRQLEGQLFQAQKMETLGTLAGGIAHDFNNLLTGILGYQDLALDTLPENDPARNYLGAARDASLRARELIDQILTFSRQADSEKVPVNLVQVVEDARRFLRATVPATIRIEVDTAAPCGRVLADATQIHQVLLNLGSNSAHAMRATGGTMRLTLQQQDLDTETAGALNNLPPGPYARIDFADTGHGMDEETRKRIFDPFFTTKEVGQGTGLGLSVVHGIIQAHRGAITVESAPGKGATFTLFLPIAQQPTVESNAPMDLVPRGNGELIAVVDDEDIVRSFAQMALEKNGYRVASFDSPAQCLEVVRRNAADYSALLTDQTMPVMKGIELAAEIRTFAPQLPVVIMSGYFSRISPEKLAQIGHVALLSKPFTNEELARTMHRAITGEPTKG